MQKSEESLLLYDATVSVVGHGKGYTCSVVLGTVQRNTAWPLPLRTLGPVWALAVMQNEHCGKETPGLRTVGMDT